MTITIPAALNSDKLTIFIVPLTALRLNHLAAMQGRSWSATMNPTKGTGLVLVSAEDAASSSFQNWVSAACWSDRIGQIAVDEIHLFFTATGYRPALQKVIPFLSRLDVPLLFLSATMPEKLVRSLKAIIGSEMQVIKENPLRANIGYHVVELTAGKIEHYVKDRIDPENLNLVFVMTKKEMERVAKSLETDMIFHGDLTLEEKAQIIRRFSQQKGAVMVCTSAFGAGVNIPNISRTFHLGCYSMIDLAQESGRGGRGGMDSQAHLIFTSLPEEFAEMKVKCIRKVIHREIDGIDLECSEGMQLCSTCQKKGI